MLPPAENAWGGWGGGWCMAGRVSCSSPADNKGACSRLTCSASVSTGPTCSVSTSLVTTGSGGMQGTGRTAGDSSLSGEGSVSH